ncbi:hypothetical protein I0C86_15165 [Plantactinospora sp. S1510]|uniref:histidine kinase n=1 Tax=Plantactinospora alkalitolerans TaxID=2789879 RepID=A0ABS0GVS1_9ACTN|nr:hypothetical protein [Plantactinospora alkalitolerans]MBF9130286.1 hypothetical protein [Plantactinospora alkalitolerans]
MTRLPWVAAGLVTALAPWYGQPGVLRLSAWIVVVAAALASSFLRLARAPLGLAAAAASMSGSLWAWQSLDYGFVDAGADSDKLLLWTTVDVGGLTALGVTLARCADRTGRRSGWLLLTPGAAVGIRLLPDAAVVEQIFLGLLGAATVLSGILLGRYLRGLDHARVAAVEQARLAQSRALATDLHDYVAHDIAGIAVAAQSARITGRHDDVASIAQIELAATRALRRLDRSIRLMRQGTDGTIPQYGLADVPDLVAACPFPVELTVAVERPEEVPAAIQATAHRVISEALTNVVRHAHPGCQVRVSATRQAGQLEVVVSNNLADAATRTRNTRPGTGLVHLRARVEALDGTMGASADNGSWRVRAMLPID